jgi:hypothetical protein
MVSDIGKMARMEKSRSSSGVMRVGNGLELHKGMQFPRRGEETGNAIPEVGVAMK